MEPNAKILIVDDEPNAVRVLAAILKAEGYAVLEALTVDQAAGIVHQKAVDAVITDIKMPGQNGYHLFDYISEHAPHVPVIFLTAYGTVDSAVQAISNGAFYYFIKPPDYYQLKKVLARAIELHRLKVKALARSKPDAADAAPRLIGRTPAMIQIFKKIAAIKDASSSVLICGETGTGKEIVAHHLHYHSCRSSRPFIAVNCAAIPRELLEAELFGYEKGAFTGAAACRIGKLEEASCGTLFLDEIGELEPALQVKLLRVLQERTICRIGSNKSIKVDFRLISSTNRDLKQEMESGAFRTDLYYRINVVCISLPPLRDRKDDIPMMVAEFLTEFCGRESKQLTISEDVMDLLTEYSWPGNVRQLRNVIEHAVIICNGHTVALGDLPDELRGPGRHHVPACAVKSLRSVELITINNALATCNGNKSKAARQLGISRKALYSRLREL